MGFGIIEAVAGRRAGDCRDATGAVRIAGLADVAAESQGHFAGLKVDLRDLGAAFLRFLILLVAHASVRVTGDTVRVVAKSVRRLQRSERDKKHERSYKSYLPHLGCSPEAWMRFSADSFFVNRSISPNISFLQDF